jgi:sugar lactone lactonase YvrE
VGRPGGLTVDRHGGVSTAISNGGAVHGYSPEGRLVEVFELPAQKVTACTFGGSDLSQLLITTSRPEARENPKAGSLFVVEPGVRGMPTREFAR